MGTAKHDLDRTYSEPPDKAACRECVGEAGLQEFVFENGSAGRCDYCEQDVEKVIPTIDLVKHVDASVRLEFKEVSTDDLPYDKEEGEFVGDVYTTRDLLEDLGLDSCDPVLFGEVIEALRTDSWCPVEGLHPTTDEEYADAWDRFVAIVQKKFRYAFLSQQVTEIDNDIGASLQTVEDLLRGFAKLHEDLMPTRKIAPDTAIFRARGTSSDRFELTSEKLGPPPFKVAATVSNRMSPAGISHFYGALDEGTATAEIVRAGHREIAVGQFSPRRTLELIDLTDPLPVPSIFNDNLNAMRPELKVLNRFVEEISKPSSSDNLLHVEYVPTQIVTEYFRLHYQRNGNAIDGIVYPSSVHRGGQCVVLFSGPQDCSDDLDDPDATLSLISARWLAE